MSLFGRRHRPADVQDEGEKPFWISFADLMTASMTLFLVVMAITIVSLTEKFESQTAADSKRRQAILKCSDHLEASANEKFPGKVRVEKIGNGEGIRLDLGSIVRFADAQYNISPDSGRFLREYIPDVLYVIDKKECAAYFRRVMIEGYTSSTGSYLTNLRLSLDRSHEVLCALSSPEFGETPLDQNVQDKIKRHFLVGGFSFNSLKGSAEESRRVELKIEFWQPADEGKRKEESEVNLARKEFGSCRR
jgi:outer membrane protein OmpA-like peptidoglycan-associated protein